MIAAEKRWGDIEYWKALGQMVDPTTMGYYLNAVDLKYDVNKEVVRQKENRRIYNHTWFKTFKVSVLVMFFCLILGKLSIRIFGGPYRFLLVIFLLPYLWRINQH